MLSLLLLKELFRLFFAIMFKSTMIDAGMAQSVEHVIGNDEVTSSNLVTSSKKGISTLVGMPFLVLLTINRNVSPKMQRILGI